MTNRQPDKRAIVGKLAARLFPMLDVYEMNLLFGEDGSTNAEIKVRLTADQVAAIVTVHKIEVQNV